MNKDSVYLVWTNNETGNVFKVARLYKQNQKFYFKYILKNVKEAQKEGFALLLTFPQIDVVYENINLFPVFAARLPDKRRPEIDKILQEYDMDCYDEFELLKRSGAKLPTDDYAFVI